MTTPPITVWSSAEVQAAWRAAISDKALVYFEALCHAPDPHGFKTTAEHSAQAGLEKKFVQRAVDWLAEHALLQVERTGPRYRLLFSLPITARPPDSNLPRPFWAVDEIKRVAHSKKVLDDIYEQDGGVCAYCTQPVPRDQANFDHVYPAGHRGADRPENLVTACGPCNGRKWHYLPGDEGYLYPQRFRGRRVARTDFVVVNERFVPQFVFVE